MSEQCPIKPSKALTTKGNCILNETSKALTAKDPAKDHPSFTPAQLPDTVIILMVNYAD
jgi:hypothetical protein